MKIKEEIKIRINERENLFKLFNNYCLCEDCKSLILCKEQPEICKVCKSDKIYWVTCLECLENNMLLIKENEKK